MERWGDPHDVPVLVTFLLSDITDLRSNVREERVVLGHSLRGDPCSREAMVAGV